MKSKTVDPNEAAFCRIVAKMLVEQTRGDAKQTEYVPVLRSRRAARKVK